MSYYKGAAYPIEFEACADRHKRNVQSLVEICCQWIVRDSTITHNTVISVPHELCHSLMRAALHLHQDRALDVLVRNWPMPVLSLKSLAPKLLTSVRPLYDTDYLTHQMKLGLKFTTTLAHTFVEGLKKRYPSKLRFLDLSGYPTDEVIVQYLSSHCLLVYNETKQKEIIDLYNEATKELPSEVKRHYQVHQTLPDDTYVIRLDVCVQSTSSGNKLWKALQISSQALSQFRLQVNQFDLSCLGEQVIRELLEYSNAENVTGLCLKYNAFTGVGVIHLAPDIERFTHLTSLDLSCNGMLLTYNTSACLVLSKLFACLPLLKRLDISNNHMKGKLSVLLSALPVGLEYLKIAGCQLVELDFVYLSTCHHMSTLNMLDIGDNNTRHFPQQLIELLTNVSSTIEILEMENCGVCEEHFTALARVCSKLRRLMYWNIQSYFTPPSMANNIFWHAVAKMPLLDTIRVSLPEEYLANASEEEVPDFDQFFCCYKSQMDGVLTSVRRQFYGDSAHKINTIIGEYTP